MENLVIFVIVVFLVLWLISTIYTLFVSSPYKRDDNADFGEMDIEQIKQILKEKLEYPYCKSIYTNESGNIDIACRYATYSVKIQDRKLVIESNPRPFTKPGNVVEEKDCLEAYLVKILLPETDVNPPIALGHFRRYIKFRILRRISGWLFLILFILYALYDNGMSLTNLTDIWKSKGISQMCFTDYSNEITIGEALDASCSKGKWSNNKIRDGLYHVTYSGYGADGSLLTILFQTDGNECSIKSLTIDEEDCTLLSGLFLEAVYENVKGGGKDGVVIDKDDINIGSDDVKNTENQDNDKLPGNDQDNTSYGLNEAATFELNDGGEISVTFTNYGEKDDTAYINYEIENIGNTDVTVGESLFSVYANDYIADLGYGANTMYEEIISVGRKASGTLYPDMLLDQVKRLEIECGDVTFLLRDTGAVDKMLGTYYRQYEEDGAVIIDEIKLYREEYNNGGLAISAKHHEDFGNEYPYDYSFNTWTFELYDDRIEYTSMIDSIGGLVIYYSENPKEEGISVTQIDPPIDPKSIEDMFTGKYEWTDNVQAVYEAVENAKQSGKSNLPDDDYYESNGDIDYLGTYLSIIEEICCSYDDYEYCEYTLYDLDGDGIKELITSEGTCEADWTNVVYTLEDGQYVSMIGQFYGSVMLYVAEDGNGLYAVSGRMEYQNIDQITKNGNQLQVETIMSGEIGVEEDFYSNDNPVSFASVTDDSLLRQ